MKTIAKYFGLGTCDIRAMLRPRSIKELMPQIKTIQHVCYGHTGDQMARGSSLSQNPYLAIDWEKYRKKGVCCSF